MGRMMPCLRIAAAALLAAAGLQAQEPIFTSRIDLVQLGVTVVGRDGTPLTVFTRDDFEV